MWQNCAPFLDTQAFMLHTLKKKKSQKDVRDLHHPQNMIYITREHAPVWDIEGEAADVIMVSREALTTIASAN